MKSGYKPRTFLGFHVRDHRDHDFLRTHEQKYGGLPAVPELPKEVDNDRGLWMPDQDAYEPIFKNPPEPSGCTNYSQNDLASNFSGVLYNPAWTEAHTHANARGGIDLRVSMGSIIGDGVMSQDGSIQKPFGSYGFVTAQGVLDWFDAIWTSLFLGSGGHREISIGVKWWPEWTTVVPGSGGGRVYVGSDGIAPTPDWSAADFSWHNAAFCGSVTKNTKGQLIRNGEQFIKCKSWQGRRVGDNGFIYFSRDQINKMFSMPGTLALIGSEAPGNDAVVVNLAWVGWVLSFVRMVANNYIMRPMGFPL